MTTFVSVWRYGADTCNHAGFNFLQKIRLMIVAPVTMSKTVNATPSQVKLRIVLPHNELPFNGFVASAITRMAPKLMAAAQTSPAIAVSGSTSLGAGN